MSKLISEPPLLVLPSLAREVGLTDAIVLQQLHYAGQRVPEGWVVRSAADWSRALRGVVSTRTIERIFPKLIEAGWVEVAVESGKPNGYRVSSDKLAEVDPPMSVGSPPPSRRGSVSREENVEKKTRTSSSKKPVKLADEIEGFAEWMGYHVVTAAELGLSMSVPGPETLSRTDLHKRFVVLAGEGRSLEDMKMASLGVLSSEWHRVNGHVRLLTVLRQPEKLQERIDAGRAAVAAREDGSDVRSKYGHLDG